MQQLLGVKAIEALVVAGSHDHEVVEFYSMPAASCSATGEKGDNW
jgi:hypothetical protein